MCPDAHHRPVGRFFASAVPDVCGDSCSRTVVRQYQYAALGHSIYPTLFITPISLRNGHPNHCSNAVDSPIVTVPSRRMENNWGSRTDDYYCSYSQGSTSAFYRRNILDVNIMAKQLRRQSQPQITISDVQIRAFRREYDSNTAITDTYFSFTAAHPVISYKKLLLGWISAVVHNWLHILADATSFSNTFSSGGMARSKSILDLIVH
jgi:hypothetical protein